MGLLEVHQALANASLIFSFIIAAYGFWRYLRRQGVDANFWGVLAAGELLYIAQIEWVLLLLGTGLRPARTGVHLLYGVLLALVLRGAYLATRAADTRREALLLSGRWPVLGRIAMRGMSTGVPVLPGG